ncbi:MarR family transcriptional regulator [Beduinella massiliensis]|uniref:MarR family transcriptional regulator n=1 Tax=Beduinella massiliensis TaxID=1852363 RepID=UPI000C81CE61
MPTQMEDRELLLSFTQSFIESVLIPFQTMFRKRLSSMQLRVMLFLCRKGPSTMTELSEAMSVPRQQTTQIVDRLHEMGLVERVREESDRRVVRIRWSAEGHRYFDPICDRFYEDMSARVHALAPEEAEAFLEAVRTLVQLLPQMGEEREDLAQ